MFRQRKPTADDLQPQTGQTARVTPAMLAGRRRKETLLPEITQMALEGHASQAIADKLGMPKRTVNYWLQEARREWIARAALSAAEMFAADLARLDAIYREAMQAWRNSQSEIDVRLVQRSEAGDGESVTKRSVRSQPQRGNAAYLTRATAAVMASWRLKGQPGPPCIDEIQRELLVADDGGTRPADTANEDLRHMNQDQLRAYRARLSATIEAIDELAELPALDDDDSPSALEDLAACHGKSATRKRTFANRRRGLAACERKSATGRRKFVARHREFATGPGRSATHHEEFTAGTKFGQVWANTHQLYSQQAEIETE